MNKNKNQSETFVNISEVDCGKSWEKQKREERKKNAKKDKRRVDNDENDW